MVGAQLDVVVALLRSRCGLRRGLAGGLERLGDDGGDDLAAVVDRVGLEEQQLAVVGLAEPRRVVVRDDGEHAGQRERAPAGRSRRSRPAAIVAVTAAA